MWAHFDAKAQYSEAAEYAAAKIACPGTATYGRGNLGRRFGCAFFLCSSGEPHDVPGLPRFRTNDVLLGTSGVGVHFSVVSI